MEIFEIVDTTIQQPELRPDRSSSTTKDKTKDLSTLISWGLPSG